MDNNFWENKDVLITGHTGFKGSWLALWLQSMGAHITGLSIDSSYSKGNYNLTGLSKSIVDWRGDISDLDTVKRVFSKNEFDVIFHLAAQPLVSESFINPVETYHSNVIGTLNLLEAMRYQSKKLIGIFITTDKVYENKETIWGYREIDPLGGYDPYSSSKACCELLINSYRQSFFNPVNYENHGKSIASVRAGNVIGGGDWALNRIIPDLMRAYENNTSISIRHPESIRPWQHVLEALKGYINLAEKLYENPTKYCEAFNFGPDPSSLYTVRDLAYSINTLLPRPIDIEFNQEDTFHETNTLCLDITKSRLALNFKPQLTFNDTLDLTLDWYLNYKRSNVHDLCLKEIKWFMDKENCDDK